MDRTWFSRSFVRAAGALSIFAGCIATVVAQPNMKTFPPVAETPITGVDAPYFRYTELGDQPHFGENGSPAQGYPHRNMPDAHYGMWYRPNSLQGQTDWCKPLPFNPRGNGSPKHTSCMRLDYAPYVVSIPNSQYGPYYYPRAEKTNCCHEECEDKKNWFKFWK